MLGSKKLNRGGRGAVAKALDLMAAGDLNAADRQLEAPELKAWPHLPAYQALVAVTQKHFMDDGVKTLNDYLARCLPSSASFTFGYDRTSPAASNTA